MTVRILTEERTAALVTRELALDAVRRALIAAAGDGSVTFPPVAGHAVDAGNRFTVKSAAATGLTGVKVGSYWPANATHGLARHGSTIVLLDQATGRLRAVVEASTANAFRTAAADAAAAEVLARPDARVLTVFGAGEQAFHECLALSAVRPVKTVNVVSRTPERGRAFVARLAEAGLDARLATAADACASADIIVTATTARAPLLDVAWVRPGTHVASMGSDAVGKRELPAELLATARGFCDLPAQSVTIGEYQHVPGITPAPIGAVLSGWAPGRLTDGDVTVFDSSGIALQDLFLAEALLSADPTPDPPRTGR
ncbi:ornithine cyclodeaminase family protein [Actinoplanes sp. NPDC051494]|uniref:ornithine cyclodeaminase family protein n=1 Tax=Actinoplanes sp. NPDC051494 TaxID=3363907 RepID=UPI0037A9A6CF